MPRRSAPGGPVEHGDVQVGPIQVVRAANANGFSPAFGHGRRGNLLPHRPRARRAAQSKPPPPAARAGGDPGIMTIVDDGSHNSHAQPSPDGRFLAFDSDRDGERGIYVANRDGWRDCGGSAVRATPRCRRGRGITSGSPTSGPELDKPSAWNLRVQPARRQCAPRHELSTRRGRPRGSPTTAASPTATRTR